MKILYCTDLILDDASAPSIHVRAICSQFTKFGHDVTVYAPKLGVRSPQTYSEIRIRTPRTLLSVFFQPQLFGLLLTRILRDRPDVIYVRHSHLLIVPTIIGRLMRIPVVLEINGILEQDARHITQTFRSRLLLVSGIFALLECINAHGASLLIAVTHGIKDYFCERYAVAEEKIVVIPNGVDTDAFQPRSKSEARRMFNLDPNAQYVGYIGSLHEWQGVRFIIEAARLLRDVPRLRFIIVGKGEEYSILQSRIADYKLHNVELRPSIPHADVSRMLDACDVCINYPLRFRDGATSPFKVYEYLACGKPVISSDVSSIRNEFGDILHYVTPESPDSLAEGVMTLLAQTQLDSAARGRAFVVSGHSWSSVAARILTLMRY